MPVAGNVASPNRAALMRAFLHRELVNPLSPAHDVAFCSHWRHGIVLLGGSFQSGSLRSPVSGGLQCPLPAAARLRTLRPSRATDRATITLDPWFVLVPTSVRAWSTPR